MTKTLLLLAVLALLINSFFMWRIATRPDTVREIPVERTIFNFEKGTVYFSGDKWHMQIEKWKGLTTFETEEK